jgi:hypothetical protein
LPYAGALTPNHSYPFPTRLTSSEGYYARNVEIDGKKYAVLDDFETKKQHLILFKEEYGQLNMFRAMQYDGQMLRYASGKSRSPSQKSRSIPGKQLPETER